MDHVEMVTVTYFVCRCCGTRVDEEDTLLGSFAARHFRPDGAVCNAAYRNDPSTRWQEAW